MADVLLENTHVFKIKPEFEAMELRKKFDSELMNIKSQSQHLSDENQQIDEAIKLLKGTDDAATLYFNYDDIDVAKNDLNIKQKKLVNTTQENRHQNSLLNRYGDAYSYLYQIKSLTDKYADDVKCSLEEIEQINPAGIIAQEQYFEMSANPNSESKQLALNVQLSSGERFALTMPPYDKPGEDKKQVKAQLSFGDKALQELNVDKLARIMEFCEMHGLSTFQMDIPYSFDGSIDFDGKMKAMLQQVQNNARIDMVANNEAELKSIEANTKELQLQNGNEELPEDVYADIPYDNEILLSVSEPEIIREANAVAPISSSQQVSAPVASTRAKPVKSKKTQADAEECLEKFIENGLRKEKNQSYFKRKSGLFGKGWTEYVIYEKPDKDNMKKDGKRNDKGEPQFTYSAKIFVKNDNGKFRFAYRTPHKKKIDDSIVNGMVGQMKDLGITHVSFPDGLQDSEKKLWRIALAENGIVPKGMGLDRSKAEAMLKAAKEKLSTEAYRKFRYRLAIQMDKDNKKKGKVVSTSEQNYIDSLINSQKYLAFTEGYGEKLKSVLRDKLDKADVNHEDGAIEKTAAYMAMRRLFDAYHETVNSVNILDSHILTATEKQNMRNAGLIGPVSEMNETQLETLYEILYENSKVEAKKEIDNALMDAKAVGGRTAKGAVRADNIILTEVFNGARNRFEKVNEILKSLGADELDFPKAFGRLHYDNFYVEHPEFLVRQPTNTPPAPTNNTPPQTNTPPAQTPSNTGNSQMATSILLNSRGGQSHGK